MRKIRYIKMFLVIGVILSLGLCALIIFASTRSKVPTQHEGARLIINRDRKDTNHYGTL